MTYTLIELVKDNVDTWFVELSKHQPTKIVLKAEETLLEEVSTMVRLRTSCTESLLDKAPQFNKSNDITPIVLY